MKRKSKNKYDREMKLLKARCGRMFESHKRRAQRHDLKVNYTREDLIKMAMVAVTTSHCPDCKCELTAKTFSFDHTLALANGGQATLSNLRVTCLRCNKMKLTLLLADFQKLMKFLREEMPEYARKEIERSLLAGSTCRFRQG